MTGREEPVAGDVSLSLLLPAKDNLTFLTHNPTGVVRVTGSA